MKSLILKNYGTEDRLKKWSATIYLNEIPGSINCEGAARIKKDIFTTKILVPFCRTFHNVITVDNKTKKIKIHSFAGGIQRCYARVKNNKLIVSNIISSLFEKNEKIYINGEILLRQISNAPTPLDNLFLDLILLEPSCVFGIKDKKIVFLGSNIKYVKSNISSIQEQIMREFDEICKPGQPLAVLLSAGIDSRLNLALCNYFSKKYNNEVIAYHEYKDKKEHDIAKHISDIAKIPFISVSRDRFKNEPLKALLSPSFIEFHGGLYRESLIRWIPYLDLIQNSNKNCTIIGMGAEAHKGKFYRDIKHLLRDTKKILGDKIRLKLDSEKIFQHLLSNKTINSSFSVLSERALIFKNLYSQIDFIHYHSYATKHSVARSPYLNAFYNIPFPFLDDSFLSQVFSLPRKDKADAKISLDLIYKLNPKFSNAKFISGNSKGFKHHVLSVFKDEINRILPKRIDISRRNEDISWNSEMIKNHIDGSSSEITSLLEKFIKSSLSGNGKKEGTIKIGCALRIYLFLRRIEKNFEIEFICK